MSEIELTLYETKALESRLAGLAIDIERFERRIATTREEMAEIQAVIDRRALDKFWEAHPGLRLAVGDKVVWDGSLVTYRTFLVGVYKIERVVIGDDPYPVWLAGESYGWVSLEHARAMREAYLQKNPA